MKLKKINIKIVILGHAKRLLDIEIVRGFKSDFFTISSIKEIESMPRSDIEDNFLDVKYSPEKIAEIVKGVSVKDNEIMIAVMAYPFYDGFYMHRVGNNKLCISLANINHYLLDAKISVENFMIKNIFEAIMLQQLVNNLEGNEVYEYVHSDTRGCLFDLNGDQRDIIYNTEKPILCNECKGRIGKKDFEQGFLDKFEKELTRIDKPKSLKLEIWAGKHPFLYSFIILIMGALLSLVGTLLLA